MAFKKPLNIGLDVDKSIDTLQLKQLIGNVHRADRLYELFQLRRPADLYAYNPRPRILTTYSLTERIPGYGWTIGDGYSLGYLEQS